MRVLDLPAATPPSAFSCNYFTTTGFMGTLRRGLAGVDTLYCFDTVGVIFLTLFPVQTAFPADDFFATLFAVPSSFASCFSAALARLSSAFFARS
jgi:hypothetical protein